MRRNIQVRVYVNKYIHVAIHKCFPRRAALRQKLTGQQYKIGLEHSAQ
jgi:hypothetical protein